MESTLEAVRTGEAELLQELESLRPGLAEKLELNKAERDLLLELGRHHKETLKHSFRVGELALKLAEHFGFSEDEKKLTARAGVLHDVGKLNVSIGVLQEIDFNKLSEEERKRNWDEIKKHPEATYRKVLLTSGEEIAKVAASHHQYKAESGDNYPKESYLNDGGEPIAPASRIVALADMVDACMSHRPKGPAKSAEDTESELVETYKDNPIFSPEEIQVAVSFREEMGGN